MNNSYETTATVADHGEVHLARVPFAPGTEVDAVPNRHRLPQRTRIPREELYERGRVH